MSRRILSRLSVAALIASAALVSACGEDDLAGPTDILGEPLLDIPLGPGVPLSPGGTAVVSQSADTLFLTLSDLPPLPSDAVFQVFLVDSVSAGTAGSQNLLPVSGALVRTRSTYRPVNRDSIVTTTTVDTTAGATTITTNPSFLNARTMVNESFELIVTGVPLGSYTHVVVAVSTPSAQTGSSHLDPTTRRGFLHTRYGDVVLVAERAVTSATASTLTSTGAGWTSDAWVGQTVEITAGTGVGQRRIIDDNTSTRLDVTPDWTTIPDATSRFEVLDISHPLRFGSFAVNTASRLNYAVAGNYDGAFRGDQLILNLRQLVRPPEGFQYAAWLFNFRAGTYERIGTMTTPPPFYDPDILRQADIAPSGPQNFLADNYIIEGTIRAPVDSNFIYEQIAIVLEPKGTADVPDFPSNIVAVIGLIPPSVTSHLPGNGKLFGKLTGPPASINTATVYLTSGSTIPVLIATSDTDGDFFFRSLTPGAYTINVVPAGASTVAATQSVVITKSAVPGGGFVGDSIYVTVPVP